MTLSSILYTRFYRDEGWATHRKAIKAMLPWVMRPVLVPIIHNAQKKRLAAASFTNDTRYAEAADVVSDTIAMLGDKPFLQGGKPSTLDCAIWPHVVRLVYFPLQPAPAKCALDSAPLMARVDRLAEATKVSLPAR